MKANFPEQIRDKILSAAKAVFPKVDLTPEEIILEHPTVEEHGDFSTSLALKLAKKVEQSPQEIAKELAEKLENDESLMLIVSKISVAGPGFINFTLNERVLMREMGEIMGMGEKYGLGKLFLGKKVMVEFTDPNPFKEFHIGHVYTNTVGEALARLFESQSAQVWRVNYQGDVGLHVAKSVWGMQRLADQMPAEEASSSEKAKFLGRAYAFGAKEYEENADSKKEIEGLNKKIYEQDARVMPLYRQGRQWSLDYFESLYQTLGTKFNRYYFESEAGEVGLALVNEHIKDGIFVKSDGAVIFPGEKYGLHNRVFVNSAGLPTYEAKEIGLAPTKYKDFPYDLSVIVTANEINEYFWVLLKALSFVYPELAEKTLHIGHGMVRLPEGKMSSRTGKVVTCEWLISEATKKAEQKLAESKVQSSTEGREKEVAVGATRQVGIAGIKYAFLRSAIGKDVEFDFDKSVDLQGDSGPYLQYTYARARSVMRKARTIEDGKLKMGVEVGKLRVDEIDSQSSVLKKPSSIFNHLSSEEVAVLRYLYRFPEVVEQAAKNYAPNLVCGYLFELAKRFNNFYNEVPILKSEAAAFRLSLVEATTVVLKNGLNLLGIEALERM